MNGVPDIRRQTGVAHEMLCHRSPDLRLDVGDLLPTQSVHSFRKPKFLRRVLPHSLNDGRWSIVLDGLGFDETTNDKRTLQLITISQRMRMVGT